jgi:chromosomal replication initiator protein DnaA
MLRRVLDDVRRYAFSGYVRTALDLKGNRGEGMIAFNSGEPMFALYAYRDTTGVRAERTYKGGKATEFVWEDSIYPEASISLHSRVALQEIVKGFPDSHITKVDLVPPATLETPKRPDALRRLKGRTDETALKIMTWSEQGYNVANLVRLYETDPSAANKALPYFEANIQRLEGLEEILRFLDTEGYEREAESLSRRMRDPEKLLDAEADLEALRRRIEGFEEDTAERQIKEDLERKKAEEKIDGVYDLILKYHNMTTTAQQTSPSPAGTSQPLPQTAPVCGVCGGALDATGDCPSCERKNRSSFGRQLNPRLTFESFVVGPNSKFAEAAARAVATAPGKSYNPLFIYSRSGLGKTHLLHAIGNQVHKDGPGKVVVYSSTELFESELVEAVTNNRLEELRAAYRRADLLLLDDVQFLAGKERIQEELFHTFNALVERGGQVALACDRLPKEIPALSERLVSRFESGLIVDIQSPDLETRMAILERRVRSDKFTVPKEVVSFIAEVCRDNVRQLEGGLNRVVAFSSLMRSAISMDLAQEILRFEKGDAKPQGRFELVEGRSYLLEEDKPDQATKLFAQRIGEGASGLVITRGNPKLLRTKLGKVDAQVLWLTDRESHSEHTVLPSLERIMLIIQEYMAAKKKTVILLDDIQYLISNTNFEGVVRLLRTIVDETSESQSVFLLSMDPESLRPQDRSILEREMEVVHPSKHD